MSRITASHLTPTNVTRTRAEARAAGSWSYRVAQGVAYLINPLILPPLLFALLLRHHGASPTEMSLGFGLGLIFFAFIPLGYLTWLVRRQRVESIEVFHRENRIKPFIATAVSYVAALILTYSIQPASGSLLVAVIACYVLNSLLATLVTFRWKISVHALSLAGFLSILLFAAGLPAPSDTVAAGRLSVDMLYFSLGLIPLVMWARVRTRAHTPAQVWAGAIFGFVVPYLELGALAAFELL